MTKNDDGIKRRRLVAKDSVAYLKTKSLLRWCMRRTKLKAAEVMTQAEIEGAVERSSGMVACPVCGFEYADHPRVEEFPELHVTCEWRVYKL